MPIEEELKHQEEDNIEVKNHHQEHQADISMEKMNKDPKISKCTCYKIIRNMLGDGSFRGWN